MENEILKRVLSSKLGIITVLIIVSTAVYFNALPNDFAYDDKEQILENRWIKDIKHIPDIFFSSVWEFRGKEWSGNYYRPLMHLTYMAEYHLFGLNPFWFHLTNIIFHSLNTVLVFMIVSVIISTSAAGGKQQEAGDLSPAFVAALFFATHPIHTEAVTWIAGFPELSFTLFYLLSFYLYIKSEARGSSNRLLTDDYGLYLLSLVFFFLATFSKETALTLPLLLVVYDYSRERDHSRPPIQGFLLKRYLPYVIVAVVYLFLRTYALGGLTPTAYRHSYLSNYQYMINVFPIVVQYFEKLLLPLNLNFFHVFHPVHSIFEIKVFLSLGFVLALALLLIKIRQRDGTIFLGLLWIIIPLLPVLYLPGIAGLGVGSVFAERYLYLPSVGFVILVSYGLMRVIGWLEVGSGRTKVVVGKATLTSLLIVVLGLYSFGTIRRNYVWRDDFSLWTDTVKKSPDSYVAHNNLGVDYNDKGLFELATEEFRKALKINPDYPPAHNNLGVVYNKKGLFDLAIVEFQEALRVDPDFANAHYNLGLALKDLGEFLRAEEEFRETVRLAPDHSMARNNLGSIYLIQKRYSLAVQEYKEALRLNPANVESLYNLALSSEKIGDLKGAIEYYRRFIEVASMEYGAQVEAAKERIKGLQGQRD